MSKKNLSSLRQAAPKSQSLFCINAAITEVYLKFAKCTDTSPSQSLTFEFFPSGWSFYSGPKCINGDCTKTLGPLFPTHKHLLSGSVFCFDVFTAWFATHWFCGFFDVDAVSSIVVFMLLVTLLDSLLPALFCPASWQLLPPGL